MKVAFSRSLSYIGIFSGCLLQFAKNAEKSELPSIFKKQEICTIETKASGICIMRPSQKVTP
jgi:hypothetical protein